MFSGQHKSSTVESWGRIHHYQHLVEYPHFNTDNLTDSIESRSILPYGKGRSYGDVCLNPNGRLCETSRLDHFICFDDKNGLIRCESGITLEVLQSITINSGWLLPVTPGTQQITLGGAIANDVHGKNHHLYGTFGDHVTYIKLLRTDGQIIHCGPNNNRMWFCATLGGLGLTGLILEVEIKLKKVNTPWLLTDNVAFGNIDEYFALAKQSDDDWEHTVAWIDCLSSPATRGIFQRGKELSNPNLIHSKHKKSISEWHITPPFSLINRFTLKAFNSAYFLLNKRNEERCMHFEPFLYPLDKIRHWNRIYGPRGFYQYQCVIPTNEETASIKDILKRIRLSGEGSFLAVLKSFGNRKPIGLLSFPMPGSTLAIDFPNNGKKTIQLMNTLDEIVNASGGRIYPAKDARMSAKTFASGYPQIGEFLRYRDPMISSGLSQRLLGS
jgi:FAD/FMN-containing dehydrogenase